MAANVNQATAAQKKEDFVKQYWHKSPKASQIMLILSSLDPATMTSELNDDVEEYTPGGGDDDVEEYTPGGDDDDVINYTPGNK